MLNVHWGVSNFFWQDADTSEWSHFKTLKEGSHPLIHHIKLLHSFAPLSNTNNQCNTFKFEWEFLSGCQSGQIQRFPKIERKKNVGRFVVCSSSRMGKVEQQWLLRVCASLCLFLECLDSVSLDLQDLNQKGWRTQALLRTTLQFWGKLGAATWITSLRGLMKHRQTVSKFLWEDAETSGWSHFKSRLRDRCLSSMECLKSSCKFHLGNKLCWVSCVTCSACNRGGTS